MWYRNLMNVSRPYVTALTFFSNSLLRVDVKSLLPRLRPTFYRPAFFQTHTQTKMHTVLAVWHKKKQKKKMNVLAGLHTRTHKLLPQHQAYFPGDCFKSEIHPLYIAQPISSPVVSAEHCYPWWRGQQTLALVLQNCVLLYSASHKM